MPPSERRFGRSEEQQKIFNTMLRKVSHDLDVLMDMLMSDDPKKAVQGNKHNGRQRKQGTVVRHPLDMVDTNTPPQQHCHYHHQQQQQKQQQQQQQQKQQEQKQQQNQQQRQSVTMYTSEKENKVVDTFPPLRRAGSLSSSIISRKSSSRSIGSNRSRKTNRSATTTRSNITVTSNSSYVKTNSGNFDGSNNKSRRKNSLHRKSSTSSQRDKRIAEFYKELEELEEMSDSSDSSDDEKPAKKIPVEEIKSHQRVEEYLMNLQQTVGDMRSDEDEGIMSDTTKSDLTSEPDNEKYGKQHRSKTVSAPYTTTYPDSMNTSPVPSSGSKDRKCIPRPPLNMFMKHESLDYNKNSIDDEFDHNSRKKHRARSLPTKPRGIAIVDKDLQECFRNKENLRKELRTNDELRNTFLKRDHDLRNSFRKKELLKDSFYRNDDGRGSYRKANNHVWIPTTTKADHQRLPTKAELLFDVASELSYSTDSDHGSTQSLSTVSSVSVAQHRNHRINPAASVPKNFIPGQATKRRDQRKKNTSSHLEKVRTVSFCFKGITCSVQSNAPRTHRALAHAGCIGLIIPGPPNHKCKQ